MTKSSGINISSVSGGSAVAIGDSVVDIGSNNRIRIADGNIVSDDEKNHENKYIPIISDEQAFERIGAAVRLNLKQLERNIEKARLDSNQFFKLTLVFSSIGFLIIMFGVILMFSEQITAGLVSTASGIIPEVTAFLFFSKDRELRKTISSYHQHMLDSQQLLTMVDVAETINDQTEKDKMKQKIISKVLNIA